MFPAVFLKLEGGLGNQLFEFAAGFYLASKLDTGLILDQYGIPLTNHLREPGLGFGAFAWPLINGKNKIQYLTKTMNPKLAAIASNFLVLEKSLTKIRMHSSNLNRLPFFLETSDDNDFFQISRPMKLHGNFQSWKIVEEAATYGFPRVFALKSVAPWVSQFLREVDLDNSLAIHLRLGLDSKNNFNYSQPTFDYYRKSIGHSESTNSGQKIYVFSDSIDEAKVVLKDLNQCEINFVTPPSEATAAEKMFLLSSFNTLICANSTFCSWAGWSIANRGGNVYYPYPFSDAEASRGSRNFPILWHAVDKFTGELINSSE
jgi:hypothetical protein